MHAPISVVYCLTVHFDISESLVVSTLGANCFQWDLCQFWRYPTDFNIEVKYENRQITWFHHFIFKMYKSHRSYDPVYAFSAAARGLSSNRCLPRPSSRHSRGLVYSSRSSLAWFNYNPLLWLVAEHWRVTAVTTRFAYTRAADASAVSRCSAYTPANACC